MCQPAWLALIVQTGPPSAAGELGRLRYTIGVYPSRERSRWYLQIHRRPHQQPWHRTDRSRVSPAGRMLIDRRLAVARTAGRMRRSPGADQTRGLTVRAERRLWGTPARGAGWREGEERGGSCM